MLLLLLSCLPPPSIGIVGGLLFVVDIVRTMRTILLWIAGGYEMLYAAIVEHEDNWKHSIYIGLGFYKTHLFYLKYTINSFRPIIFPDMNTTQLHGQFVLLQTSITGAVIIPSSFVCGFYDY